MQYPLFLLLSALLGSTSAAAQPTYKLGLRGGLNRATTTLDAASTGGSNPSWSATKSVVCAWQAGAVLEIAFQKIAFQPALVFSQKGERFNTHTSVVGFAGTFDQRTRRVSRYNWLELPMNVVYTVHGVQLFAGPYVALGLGGRQHSAVKLSSFPPIIGPDEYEFDRKNNYGSDTYNRRLDAGVNFGLGYRKGPLQAQFSYGLGLRNLHQEPNIYIIGENPNYHNFNADAAYNRVVQLTGTYFFTL